MWNEGPHSGWRKQTAGIYVGWSEAVVFVFSQKFVLSILMRHLSVYFCLTFFTPP